MSVFGEAYFSENKAGKASFKKHQVCFDQSSSIVILSVQFIHYIIIDTLENSCKLKIHIGFGVGIRRRPEKDRTRDIKKS